MAAGLSKTKWNENDGGNLLPLSESQSNLLINLSYKGKKDEREILSTSSATLETIWTSHDSRNSLLYGDNLPILASLYQSEVFRGKVRLIYIDPPYSTRSVFQSRSQNNAYTDLLVGADYLEFIRERLILLRELLASDGSIYVHLDENMAFYIKVIMDEVFGTKNFRNFITRKKCNPKNFTRKTYGDISDYILFYTKTGDYVWNRPVEKWTEERAAKEYTYTETETGRKYKKVPIHATGTRNGETGKPWRGMMPPPGKHWQYTPKILDEMDERGEIYWSSTGNPRRKIYLDNTEGVAIQDLWLDFKDAHNQNIKITGYPTEKNPDLLKRIIEASSNVGDIVLDCFAGSGTALDVASNLERRWIGIDNSPEAIDTILKRFRNGTKPMGDFVNSSKTKVENGRLFDLQEAITDFTLLASSEYLPELEDIIKSWLTWQETTI
jgi:adenine-specific DNA-methyltransferase